MSNEHEEGLIDNSTEKDKDTIENPSIEITNIQLENPNKQSDTSAETKKIFSHDENKIFKFLIISKLINDLSAIAFMLLIYYISKANYKYWQIYDLLEKVLSLGLSILPNIFGVSLASATIISIFKRNAVDTTYIKLITHTLIPQLMAFSFLYIVTIIKYLDFHPSYSDGQFVNSIVLIFIIGVNFYSIAILIEFIIFILINSLTRKEEVVKIISEAKP